MKLAANHSHQDVVKRARPPGLALRVLAAYVMPALIAAFAIGCASTEEVDTSGMSFSAKPIYGKVVWNDLMTEDLDAARRFYGGVLGWTFDNYSGRLGRGRYAIARS